jgi:hypothetical protein
MCNKNACKPSHGDGKYYLSEDGEEPIKKTIFEAKALGKINGFYRYMAGIEVTKYD